jgi:Asp-tRNA(Asn)/Glu-tRNA(Gln) amidotransferase A subunit family amidase
VVERIKAAGAIILGKTQVPEPGYSGTGHPGTKDERYPGGFQLGCLPSR